MFVNNTQSDDSDFWLVKKYMQQHLNFLLSHSTGGLFQKMSLRRESTCPWDGGEGLTHSYGYCECKTGGGGDEIEDSFKGVVVWHNLPPTDHQGQFLEQAWCCVLYDIMFEL